MSSTSDTFQPSHQFQMAAGYLSSASSLRQVSSSIKLELYGLYKYLTVSRSPDSSRPSIFDMTGRAKWDAWDAAGKKYDGPGQVEKRYLEIARSLGWSLEKSIRGKQRDPGHEDSDVDLEHLSDEDGSPHSGQSISGGLGTSVSTIARPEKQETIDDSLHGLAISGDVVGLTSLLDQSPGLDLNSLDEYGYAPMHLACDRGHIEVVRLLLSKGARRDVKDPDDLTPLELSREAGHVEITGLLESNA